MMTTLKKPVLSVLGGVLALFVFCDETPSAKAATAAVGGGTYVLAKRNQHPAVGTVVTKDMNTEMTDAGLALTAGDKEIKGSATRTSVGRQTMEILSQDKMRHLVVSQESTGEMKLNGKVKPTPEKPNPLLALPVILERKGGTWTASLESGAAPTPEQKKRLEKLAKSSNHDADFEMYGDTPRKPGDKWNVDPSKLMNFLDTESLTGTYSVEFVEVKEFQGVQCAVLKSTFDFKGVSSSDDSKEMKMSLKGEAIARRSLADLTDIDVEVSGTMTLEGEPAPNVTMRIEGPMKFTEKISLKKP